MSCTVLHRPTPSYTNGVPFARGPCCQSVRAELLLHNVEDGGMILYDTLGTTEENRRIMDEMREVARGYHRTVIAPRESMETPVMLVAWQRLQRFDAIEPEAMRVVLDAFGTIDRHRVDSSGSLTREASRWHSGS